MSGRLDELKKLLEQAKLGLPLRYQEESDAYTHIVRDSGNQHIVQLKQTVASSEEARARLITEAINALPKLIACAEALEALMFHVEASKAMKGLEGLLVEWRTVSGKHFVHSLRDGIQCADELQPFLERLKALEQGLECEYGAVEDETCTCFKCALHAILHGEQGTEEAK